MERDDILSALKLSLKDIVDLFDESELEQAISIASYETGWKLPVTKNFRCYWIIERSKRACVSMLLFASAHKFKFKQINLNQRFDHYNAMLTQMDKLFEQAKKENPEEFVDAEAIDALTPEERISRFGFYVPNIMRYTPSGKFPAHRGR